MTDAIVNTLMEAADLVPTLAADYHLEPPIQCELIRVASTTPTWSRRGRANTSCAYISMASITSRPQTTSAPSSTCSPSCTVRASPSPARSRARAAPPSAGWRRQGGPRACALFAFADGECVRDPTVDQARTLGTAVARLHLAADRYPSPYPRYHLDLRYLSERPMRLMEDHLRALGREGLEMYRPAVAALENRVRSIPMGRGAYGIIHGDLHRGNYHFNAAVGVTLFDFDHGGYGWRAYDLATCQGQLKEAGGAFLEEYERLRPLSEAERESFGAFLQLRPIWDKGDVLATVAVWGEGSLDSDFADGITAMFEKLFPSA